MLMARKSKWGRLLLTDRARSQAKLKEKLAIPVVPLTFSALDVEENKVLAAEEAAQKEKKRLRKKKAAQSQHVSSTPHGLTKS